MHTLHFNITMGRIILPRINITNSTKLLLLNKKGYSLYLKVFLLTLGCVGLDAQDFIRLSDMDISKGHQTYAAPVKNKAVTGEPIKINGVPYPLGVGVHSYSSFRIVVNNGRSFTAKVGVQESNINDSSPDITSIPLTDGKRVFYRTSPTARHFVGVEGGEGSVAKGSVVFKAVLNGEEIYNSGLMRAGEPAQEVEFELKRGILDLIVEDGGDGVSGDHAVWIDPTFNYMEIAPVIEELEFLADSPPQSQKVLELLDRRMSNLETVDLPLSQTDYDWLIDDSRVIASVYKKDNGRDIVLTNGLISRVFRISPNLATIDYINHMTGESLLRSVSNEGKLHIDGASISIGGLSKQPEYGYTMMKWVDELQAVKDAFVLEDFYVNDLRERMPWKRVRWASNTEAPTGKELVFVLSRDKVKVKVHFALYDRIPTLSKWIEVINEGDHLIQLDAFKLEQLAMVEGESLVNTPEHWVKPNIHIESDYAFGSMQQRISDKTTHWEEDPRYTSQTNYPLNLPCLLEVKLPLGPATAIQPGDTLETFRVWETPLDTREKERRGLFLRKMYRIISPWVTENPIFLHLVSSDEKVVRAAVDQCVEVGYEMIILSFGSGVNMEDESEANYEKFRKLVEYANSKGIELGGYSLLSSRWISDDVDVINPETGKRGGMIFGSSPCLSSEWGHEYFRKIKKFFDETGMSVFENDGSYPGNVCASESHEHHNGLSDSQWKQYGQIQDLYKWMRSKGIYMNVPDFYVNSGSNKTGIGYREVNWSLPRARQLMLGRMNIYDGLWDRTPSMCWTFTPLTQYHGGGAAATIEPLSEHIDDYKNQMIQNYGSGVQSCYRGPRLYDTGETKAVVKEVIDWYKKYRLILNSDLIHLRRPSGKDWDGFMHVNPALKEKGFVMLFNPTDEEIERQIELPVYYTGLSEKAGVREKEGEVREFQISRDYKIDLKIKIPANSYNWFVIE